MFYRETVGLFVDLFLKGGIEVSTFSDPNATGHSDTSLLVRTIIQPDGDMITFLSQHALREAGCWQIHLDKLGDKVRTLRLLKIMPEILMSLVSTIALLLTGLWSEYDPDLMAAAFGVMLVCGALVLMTSGARIDAERMKVGFRKEMAAYIWRVVFATKVPGYLLRIVSVGLPLVILLCKQMIAIGLLIPLVVLLLKPTGWFLFRCYVRFETR